MHFKDVLVDIEKLVGKELHSINPKTPSIYVTALDRSLEKYFVSNSPNSKGAARSFRELEDIWNELTIKGFSNVDQALYGGGSSRNQPETVFAHLPYIQHFRYKNRKHLLLRNDAVHELGVLSELQSSELRMVRKKIDNYTALSNQTIADSQASIVQTLKSAFDAVTKKFPGDVIVEEAEKAVNSLLKLNQQVSEAVVTLDGGISSRTDNVIDVTSSDKSIDELIDDESLTGIENDVEKEAVGPIHQGKTKIRQLTPVVSLIFDRLSFGEIELQPDFQRKDRVWPEPRKSKLIESILMGLPLPVFYFAERPNGDWIIVDGLQRITTIYDFMRGEFSLNGLEVLDELNGKSFSGLERAEQRKIREYPLTAHLIDMATDKDNIIVELFHRINTYGVKLSEQEIRSALNQGTSVKFLRYLASTPEFKSVTQGKIKPDRQKDMELCLSALSFMLNGYKKFDNQYNKYLSDAMEGMNAHDIKLDDESLLDEGMSKLSAEHSPVYSLIADKFKNGLKIAEDVFGDYAFKKIPDSAKKVPISKPLFELIVTYFSELSEEQAQQVVSRSDELIDMLYEAIDKDSADYADWESQKYEKEGRGLQYSISQSTGKNVTVRFRFESFREILKQSTGVDVELSPILSGVNQ
ncbi:DUF262 domain-containing protein [Vibrio vulnificus]|uniref:DUF262 domain-containing protein n=1 Tax=Vibrio vulnificus TaxID=672 RepID=UPI000D3EB4E6|nr:DUF262 domain-containing protein [Vibrio vulnificus]EIO3936999.1 DUF262 domain-containing protein [Vibrio vulnificus]EKD7161536.1 DUF262 domain-containing protein [Vibrio vulnificus]EKZ9054291.1 DUF262 domain-containing protein [Vibrio vulnificus]MCU8248554.1 DUF262 domain-containing protein [Vibrio vulnificus]PUZ95974.1 hypothetical protein DC364_10375 [Vibrio vulnificus]